MSEIDELERRIAAALDRIATGVESLGGAGAASGGDDTVLEAAAALAEAQAALEEERLANAQLEERVRAIRTKQETEVAALRAEAEEARARLAALDGDLQRLRHANEMLTGTNQELRAALEENVGEPHLINKAMLAELESLRAARAVETSEAQALLGALAPLLADAAGTDAESDADAPQTEEAT
ncbi:hypothetical protein SAMN05421759_10552 [Roseivivax lentus]|uniref:Uncharacterized protein n=1 Tax=Roseivivax lentus TaxID=633194 RepID=A0A1N7MPQ4_9RHOB|nr:hypothetical protein [Roseivivax lentus]SIS87911.1 hypothetical protein SAMN05421759_10552 [Roseivivax lentus]